MLLYENASNSVTACGRAAVCCSRSVLPTREPAGGPLEAAFPTEHEVRTLQAAIVRPQTAIVSRNETRSEGRSFAPCSSAAFLARPTPVHPVVVTFFRPPPFPRALSRKRRASSVRPARFLLPTRGNVFWVVVVSAGRFYFPLQRCGALAYRG